MRRPLCRLTLLAMACVAGSLSAQDAERRPAVTSYDGEWSFTRLAYTSNQNGSRYGRRGGGSADTDYPEAETYLRLGLDRLTRISLGTDQFIRPDDPDLMNYPWLYAVEVGRWHLKEEEAANLREYLLRGGFLLVDDFWGTIQWDDFEVSMRRVFNDRPIVEIPETDALMTLVYDVDKSIQIPGISTIRSGVTSQQDGYVPYWRGIYDDDGRLMVAINFNMDLGDAWEHANDPDYPEPMTGLAIRYAVNYVIYSMTH
jgi:hypothetical protein